MVFAAFLDFGMFIYDIQFQSARSFPSATNVPPLLRFLKCLSQLSSFLLFQLHLSVMPQSSLSLYFSLATFNAMMYTIGNSFIFWIELRRASRSVRHYKHCPLRYKCSFFCLCGPKKGPLLECLKFWFESSWTKIPEKRHLHPTA